MKTSSNILLFPHPDFEGHFIHYDRTREFGWVVPEVGDAFLADFYKSRYRNVRQENPSPDYVTGMRRRASAQRDFIIRHLKQSTLSSILDIGCGAGLLLEAFHNPRVKLVGFESDEVMARWAQASLAAAVIHNRYFSVQDEAAEKFDLITISHVLEHIPRPGDFMRSLKEHLNPGGHVFIEVPNDPIDCVSIQANMRIKGLAHINFFTLPSLRSTLLEANYSDCWSDSYGGKIEDYWSEQIRGTPKRSRLASLFRCKSSRKAVSDTAPTHACPISGRGMYLRTLIKSAPSDSMSLD